MPGGPTSCDPSAAVSTRRANARARWYTLQSRAAQGPLDQPNVRAKLLTAAGAILLALLVLEVVLRVFAARIGEPLAPPLPGEIGRYVSHPFLPYAGRPSADYVSHNPEGGGLPPVIRVRNNRYGFRAHEFPASKNPEDVFVLAFGGSTTFGIAANNEDTWPEILERLLQAHYPAKRVQVFNMGMDMATSAVSVVNLALVGVHLKPDLIIPYEGYNDLAALGWANFRTDQAHFYRNITPEKIWPGARRSLPAALMHSFAVRFIAGVIDETAGLNSLASYARYVETEANPDRLFGIEAMLDNLKTMHAMADGVGARSLFATFQFREGDEGAAPRLNDALRRLFASKRYDYVDLDARLPDHDASLQFDECHFTQKGLDLVARYFADYIIEHGLIEARH
jgi:lysophospholipase L1-like esterase